MDRQVSLWMDYVNDHPISEIEVPHSVTEYFFKRQAYLRKLRQEQILEENER